jgi:hypothetical protein
VNIAMATMQKYLNRKVKEHHWFCVRLLDTEPNEEEWEEITRKTDEVKELSKRMIQALERMRILVEERTSTRSKSLV